MAFKIAVFTVMAAMLAWILGGTLFPRPVTAMQTGSIEAGGWRWSWQAEIKPDKGSLAWYLVHAKSTSDDWDRPSGGGPFAVVEPLQQVSLSPDQDVLFTVQVWLEGQSGPATALVVRSDGSLTRVQPSPTG